MPPCPTSCPAGVRRRTRDRTRRMRHELSVESAARPAGAGLSLHAGEYPQRGGESLDAGRATQDILDPGRARARTIAIRQGRRRTRHSTPVRPAATLPGRHARHAGVAAHGPASARPGPRRGLPAERSPQSAGRLSGRERRPAQWLDAGGPATPVAGPRQPGVRQRLQPHDATGRGAIRAELGPVPAELEPGRAGDAAWTCRPTRRTLGRR